MALTKLLDSSSFFSKDEAIVTVIDFDKDSLTKQAADSEILNYVQGIKPDPEYIYVHILAMGAGEYYGANRNADYFPENNLIDCYKTFETAPAHIFRNHVNKRPEIAIGKVIFAIYNNRMHRVELIASIHRIKGADVVDRIEQGDFPATSMACRTPYDVCSICGNKAHTRQEYCEHLRDQLGKVYGDGRKVMALNVANLNFFDMSIVIRPADITSSVLQKVASEDHHIVGSAEMAESEGLLESGVTKQAAIHKLSEFIKEIEGGEVIDHSEVLEPLLAKVQDPDHSIINALVSFKLHEILDTMAHLGMSPSLTFLGELIGRKTLGQSAIGIGHLVQNIINLAGAKNLELPKDEALSLGNPNFAIANTLMPFVPTSSYLPEYVEKRAAELSGNNIGYTGMGPHIEPSAYDLFRQSNFKGEDNKSGLMKVLQTILTIGGAAMVAKWYITRTIEQKIKENQQPNNHGVKIILVKSASDYALTYKLAKAAMIQSVTSK
jgi:hypothetical protein